MAKSKEIINELLVEVFNHILSIEETTLRHRGVTLSMTEVHVLEAIRNVSDTTMGSVAKKLRVTLGTLTTSVNVLVKKGYVYRYRDEEDRRKVYLKLTEEALKVLVIHDEFHDEMIDSIFKELELDKDEALMKSLDSIRLYFKDKY
ncbi:Transcriptional regulator, MarR family [Alteracholeplasma palmae J233]|uniref:Transcriptional regulator, MarR family n=1 Tax=Alteracholeplasma palmae (strain ATCC 49389 / J233) TaxID=1318466 RepID=U4KQP3_ALTPJ|nr:MarR family transcriptional regulator [Alteracholeplasma palmae]CCV64930.1 Transcriptional regulator, MarR family [Alteracholeplasma palmae J233]